MAEPINPTTVEGFVQAATTNPNVAPAATPELPESPIITATEQGMNPPAQPAEGALPGVTPVNTSQLQEGNGATLDPLIQEFLPGAGSKFRGNQEAQPALVGGQTDIPSVEGQTINGVSPVAGEAPTGGAAATSLEAVGTPDTSAGDGSLFASSESSTVNPPMPDNLKDQETSSTNSSEIATVVNKMKAVEEKRLRLIGKAGNVLTIAADNSKTTEQKVEAVLDELSDDEQMAA